ncbi:hypothetical protein FA95DRAFT_663052 [Auriscalpium vulgare]|uniref:Uncharacterized protein n=1 Tax=Auriscalpium vulgare TaxID=40419 RepID=A0ACB8S1R7_9AGAM|nr:hypothetical protein FA95DRAFT_663052 [Auriscalpium vulgare]
MVLTPSVTRPLNSVPPLGPTFAFAFALSTGAVVATASKALAKHANAVMFACRMPSQMRHMHQLILDAKSTFKYTSYS